MQLYRKTGDKGTTGLFGPTRVSKHHPRLDAYGTVDELNAYLGLLRSYPVEEEIKKDICQIQKKLFTIGSNLANDDKSGTIKIPEIKTEDIIVLERRIDEITENLPELTAFIIPGGHAAPSFCHIARSICRRAERMVVRLNENHTIILQYLNRLSDYLFTLARKLAKDFNSEEIKWKAE